MQFLYRTRSLSLSNDGSLQSETATASSFFLSSFAASARTQMDDKPAAIEMLFGSIAALVGAVANTVVPVHSRLSSHLISDRLRPFLSLLIEDLIRFHSHCTILLLPAVLDVNTSHYLLHQRHQEGGGEWWRGGILTSGKLQIIVSPVCFRQMRSWEKGKCATRANIYYPSLYLFASISWSWLAGHHHQQQLSWQKTWWMTHRGARWVSLTGCQWREYKYQIRFFCCFSLPCMLSEWLWGENRGRLALIVGAKIKIATLIGAPEDNDKAILSRDGEGEGGWGGR